MKTTPDVTLSVCVTKYYIFLHPRWDLNFVPFQKKITHFWNIVQETSEIVKKISGNTATLIIFFISEVFFSSKGEESPVPYLSVFWANCLRLKRTKVTKGNAPTWFSFSQFLTSLKNTSFEKVTSSIQCTKKRPFFLSSTGRTLGKIAATPN